MIVTHPRNAALTVVALSGIAPRNHVYEWVTALSDLPVNVVGVQDPHDAWWQIDARAALREIKGAIDAMGTAAWLAVGGSAGGFGAVLFGRLLGAAGVLAFVPQSACGETKRRLGDLRWRDHCEQTPALDLAAWGDGVEVHVGEDAQDVMHAARFRGATVHRHAGCGHDLPHTLKRDGHLAAILQEATAGAML